MSALSDALTAAGITYAWARAPIEGRVCLWLYMDDETLGLLTMTPAQSKRLREAADVRV